MVIEKSIGKKWKMRKKKSRTEIEPIRRSRSFIELDEQGAFVTVRF